MSHKNIHLECPLVQITDGEAVLSSKIICDDKPCELWFSLSEKYAHWFAADRSDGFVVALLLQAMERGENIVTDAPMSSRLWHSLTNFYIPMMAGAFANLHSIHIQPASLVEESVGGRAVVTGFSGGVDSFAAVVQHWQREESPSHKVSHFLFHNVGSHSTGNHDAARRLFYQRFETLKPFLIEAGIPFVPVDSNCSEVFPIDFIRMHPALNASIPLILQNHFKRYFYASTYKYADCGVTRSDDIARFDPLAFHLFSTEGLDCVSTGCQLSRVEKTKLVADFEPSYRYLNVCVDPAYEGRNCSVCFKCCRTLLTLELLGKVHLYEKIFDLQRFRSVRSRYIRDSVMTAYRGSFEAEIADLAREVSNEPWADKLRRKHARKETAEQIGQWLAKGRKIPRALAKRVWGGTQ